MPRFLTGATGQRLKEQAATAATIQRETGLADTDDGLCHAEATVAVKEPMIKIRTARTSIGSKRSAEAGCLTTLNLVVSNQAFDTISEGRTVCPSDEGIEHT